MCCVGGVVVPHGSHSASHPEVTESKNKSWNPFEITVTLVFKTSLRSISHVL